MVFCLEDMVELILKGDRIQIHSRFCYLFPRHAACFNGFSLSPAPQCPLSLYHTQQQILPPRTFVVYHISVTSMGVGGVVFPPESCTTALTGLKRSRSTKYKHTSINETNTSAFWYNFHLENQSACLWGGLHTWHGLAVPQGLKNLNVSGTANPASTGNTEDYLLLCSGSSAAF